MIPVLWDSSLPFAVLLLLLCFILTSDDAAAGAAGAAATQKYTCVDPITNKVNNYEDLDLNKITITMPGAKPSIDDDYLCTTQELPKDTSYIVQFEAQSSSVVAHHIILFGCRDPFRSDGGVWPCNSICNGGEPQILYAWAKNADPARLPCDVGFLIGQGTNISFIVMQVHYKTKFSDSQPSDVSGLSLYVTKKKQKYSAGIFLLDSDRGVIPKQTPLYNVDVSCKFPRGAIYPFAFRTHAHSLAQVISGYKYNGSWALIGKSNPQWPQAFYPAEKNIKIEAGDVVVARCTYNSTGRNRATGIGATHEDEMCNFYMMYYSDSTEHIENFMECINNNVPNIAGDIPVSSTDQLPYNPYLEKKALQPNSLLSNPKSGQQSNAQPESTEKPSSPQLLQDMTYVADWPDMKGVTLGQVSGVSVGPDGTVHVFHRGPQVWNSRSFNKSNIFQDQNKPILVPTVVVFSKEGKLLHQWGSNMFFMPHGITVDKNGSVWLTDVALHQVLRFPVGETKPDLELGERFRPDNDKQHFCQPSSVAVMSDGQFFVADGYCNSRILKFSKEGSFLTQWGHSDSKTLADGFPAPSVFFIIHAITVAEDSQMVCASDRGNGRIQCFDLNGKFLRQIHLKEFGDVVFSIDYAYQHGGILFAVNGRQNHQKKPCKVFAIDINTGSMLSSWNCPKGLSFAHDISVDTENLAVYVADLLAKTVWKLKMNITNATGKFSVRSRIPSSVATGNIPITDHGMEAESGSSFKASVIVGSLLVAPMFFIVLITVFVRYYHAGKLKCCHNDTTRRSMAGHQHRSFFGNLLIDRHKGFNPLNTEDSDHEIDPLNNSDDEDDYRISRKT